MDISRFRKILSAPWFALIIIALAAFVVYSNVYRCPFVFDDIHSIVENVGIRDLSNFSSPDRFLKSRAVVDFTFALNYRFGKLDVFGYHLVNILIHIINGFIVYFLALAILGRLLRLSREEAQGSKLEGQRKEGKAQKKKGKGKKGKKTGGVSQSSILDLQSSIPLIALFAAIIFIVHPIQTQAVTYIVQRYASLAALFYMGSVLFYLKGRVLAQSPKLKAQSLASHRPSTFSLQSSAFFILSIVCGLLAFMSKQNTASLPGAIVLVECMCFSGTWRERARRFLWIMPVLVLFAAFILYAMGLFSGAGIGSMLEDVSDLTRETELVSRWSYLCTQFNVLVIYIRLLFLPVGQNLDYMYRFNTSFFNDLTPFAFAFLAGLVGLAIWKRKKYPVVTVAIFWFFITLSVESSIIPIRDALFEHRLYLSMFGFALFAAWLPFRFLPKKRALAVLLCVSIVISLGTATYLRNRVWQDDLTLWTDVMAKSPKNLRSQGNLGTALFKNGRLEDAFNCFSGMLRAKPKNARTNYNLGAVLEKQGRIDEAVRYYSEAVRIDQRNVKAHYNLGSVFARQGRLDEAIHHYTAAVRIMPWHADAHYNLGIALAGKGDSDNAIHHLSETLRIMPGHAKAHYDLGNLLAGQGRLDEAISHLSEAVRLHPDDNVPVCYKIACVYARQNKIEKSIAWLKKAVDRGFNRGDLLRNDKDLENIRGTSYYRSLIRD